MAIVTARDTIQRALIKLGVLRANGVMTSEDAGSGLASLTSLYAEWVSQGTFGRVQNINISAPQASPVTAGMNQHINITTDTAVTVDLPATVPYDYWWTWRPMRDYGWGKNVPVGADTTSNVPRDKSVVMVTDEFNPARATYVYDGTIQRWVRTDEFGLNDEAPLSSRGTDGLASILAVRMSEEYGGDLLTPGTMMAANRYKTALVSRHGEDDCYDGW